MSSIIRIICGLALIAFSWTVYQKNSVAIEAGAPVDIAGYAPGGTPQQVTMAFGAVGLVGGGMVLLGLIGLLRGKKK